MGLKAKDVRCVECGGGVCICSHSDTEWAAHCMDCDNAIGKIGFYDPCAKSQEEAEEMWIKLNTRVDKE